MRPSVLRPDARLAHLKEYGNGEMNTVLKTPKSCTMGTPYSEILNSITSKVVLKNKSWGLLAGAVSRARAPDLGVVNVSPMLGPEVA